MREVGTNEVSSEQARPRDGLEPADTAYRLTSARDLALFLIDRAVVVTSWNEGAERIMGYRAPEIVGKPVSIFFAEGQAEDAARELEVAAREGAFQKVGWQKRKDGSRFWAAVTVSPLRDERGGLVGFGCIARDLDEPKLAEDALRASEERFRLLVTCVRDYAIFMLDPDGNIVSWNTGAQQLKGWVRSEVLGKHFSIFYPPEDVNAGKCEHELEVAARVGRFEDLGWRVRKDGSRFFANVVITAIRDEKGELRGFAKVTRDVTDRRRAEEQLRESEERFRLLVEGVTDDAIYMLDREGHVVLWNTGAQRIKGYSSQEILGKHFSIFYTPEDRAGNKAVVELRRATEEGRFEEEGWRVRKDGTRFWASVILTALRNERGEHVGFAKVTRDLTQRKREEETRIQLALEQVARREAETRAREHAELIAQLEEANAKLRAAVAARDDFLTIASHELKTPLHTLGMQVSSGLWLLEGKNAAPDKLKKRMQGAQLEVHRLNRLVTNLLDVSRIAANRLVLEPTKMDLAALAREVVERDREDIVRSGSPVAIVAPGPVEGTWDKLRLDQVLTNLLGNALKYGEKKPVVVTVEATPGGARFSVKDQGLGIAPQDQERIFQRFERAVSSRNHSGFGIGLWIVKQIVDALGGKVSVTSAVGKGSTFVVDLPRESAARG